MAEARAGGGIPATPGEPSTELLQRVKALALSFGMDPAVVEAALHNWVAAYDLDLTRRADG